MILKYTIAAARATSLKPMSCSHQIFRVFATKAKTVVATLECEQKFNVTQTLLQHLHNTNREEPPIPGSLIFARLPDTTLFDQYFDKDSTLASRGLWLRRRRTQSFLSKSQPSSPSSLRPPSQTTSTTWELKSRVSGDYANSQFEEVVGEEAVSALLQKLAPTLTLHRIPLIADLTTYREAWDARVESSEEVGRPFRVCIDTCSSPSFVEGKSDFHHSVGEVELCSQVGILDQDPRTAEEMKKMGAGLLKRELDVFMRKNEGLFPAFPVPIGKLSAYFAWRKRLEGM